MTSFYKTAYFMPQNLYNILYKNLKGFCIVMNDEIKFDPQLYADNEIDRITLRVTHKQKENLAKIAQAENISLNTLIVRCIEFALRNK